MVANATTSTSEQRLQTFGVSWKQFQAIASSFEGIPGIRLTHCEGTLEIVTISKLHEMLKSIAHPGD